MLHGNELAEILQSVNIANLIHELNAADDINKMPISRLDVILMTSLFVSATRRRPNVAAHAAGSADETAFYKVVQVESM